MQSNDTRSQAQPHTCTATARPSCDRPDGDPLVPRFKRFCPWTNTGTSCLDGVDDDSPCPNCGERGLWRDSVDVGVGTIYGPYGCPCGWSEDSEFNSVRDRPSAPDGWYATPQGVLVNRGREREEIDAGLARFGLRPMSELLGEPS